MSQLTKQQLKGENQTQFPNNNVGAITPSHLRAFNVDMIDSTVNQTDFTNFSGSVAGEIDALEAFSSSLTTAFVSTASFNSYTQSNDQKWTNIGAQSGSWITESESGSFLITASFDNGTRNLTFTKGDASTFAVNIPDVSGSAGDFVTTASFNSYTQSNDSRVNALESATSSYATAAITASSLITASVSLNTITFTKGDGSTFPLTIDTGSGGGGGNISVQDEGSILGDATSFNFNGAGVTATLSAGTASITIPGGGGSIDTGSFATTGSNFFVGIESINEVAGTAVGEVYLLGRSGSLFIANQLSAGGGPSYASIAHISSSQVNANTNLIFKPNSGAAPIIVSGSSNIFTNQSSVTTGYVRYVGGSSNIYMNATGIPQLTGSAASVSGNRPTMNGNIIPHQSGLVINQSVNPGTWNINANILTNVGTTTFNTLGNTGNITFSGNIGASVNATINSPSRSIAEVNAGASGSSPLTMQNNLLLASNIQYQGPISSSAHGISTNIIQGGLFANLQSGSRVYTINANSINGTLNIDDNTVFAPTLGSNHTYNNNIINGTAIFINQASSSFNVTNNNLNGVTITTRLDSSGVTLAGARTSVVNGNALFGASNNILFSGSMGANPTSRNFAGNLIAGTFNSASLVGDGGSKAMTATAILGSGLNVFGTAKNDLSGVPIANVGSLFAGRYNAEDGSRAQSAETIFAVGTGNSGSAGIFRKTGFLIDSGSNTFIEGTLNVSGSSTLSGSLYIQSGSTLPVSTGSAILTWDAATGQVKQASYSTIISASVSSAEFWSTTTQSGSAGVSGSLSFNNSGSFYNVSVVNGTQLTVANAGVYNIQFSAQLETSAGADTVYVWFKKNGNNISDSASKAVLANNTAQIMTVNILDEAQANDYYEIAYQNLNGHATILAEAASGNIPAIPSVIATVMQVR